MSELFDKSIRTLELPRVLELLSEQAVSTEAKARALRVRPGTEPEEVLRLLDIPPRPLVEREKTYIAAWDDMGFADDAIRLAYERTLFQKQSMNWAYMNSILKRWHGAGLHTVAEIETGDKPPARAAQSGGKAAAPKAPAPRQNFQPSADRVQKNADWLDRFLAEQEAGPNGPAGK